MHKNTQNTKTLKKHKSPNERKIQHMRNIIKYQLSGNGGTRSLPAMPHRLQHLNIRFIQIGRRGPEIGQTLGFWTLRSIFGNEFV